MEATMYQVENVFRIAKTFYFGNPEPVFLFRLLFSLKLEKKIFIRKKCLLNELTFFSKLTISSSSSSIERFLCNEASIFQKGENFY